MRNITERFVVRFLKFLLLLALLPAPLLTRGAESLVAPGFRPVPHGVHALVGARIIRNPKDKPMVGTIIIRDGLIAAVGEGVKIPEDARVWDMKGRTIYAGFIDPYLAVDATNTPTKTTMTQQIQERAEDVGMGLTSDGIRFFGIPGSETDPGRPGPGSELAPVTPQQRVADSYTPKSKTLEEMHGLGFTAANMVSIRGILPGTSAFVNLANVNPNQAVLKGDVFQHVIFDTRMTPSKSYPRSLMGVIAVVRQHFFAAEDYLEDRAHYERHATKRKRPALNPALEALGPAVRQEMAVMFEPGSALMVDRAAQVARELKVRFHVVASGDEWRRPDLAKATEAAFVVPLFFPEIPKMPEDDDWDQVSLDRLRAWDWAPENAAVLKQQGLEVALTTHGLAARKKFRKNLELAVARGLAEGDALAGLTTVPAKLCGLDDRLGTIDVGKIANLTVVEGDSYFEAKTRVQEVWIDGQIHHVEPGRKTEAQKPEPEKEAKPEVRKTRTARSPMEGRGPLREAPAVLVREATLWTSGPEGRLKESDLLIVDGKIKAVGQNLVMPGKHKDEGVVIEGRGLHVTPGLIDAHSHSMILGGVNEGSLPSSAMVRIGDVVNSETANIYKQLAGGLTVANLLHGSANPIGGQNAIIKLREGAAPETMKLGVAPPGVKFALGENVKQSNWGDDNVTRFPQSRMGVPTFMANRFTAARQYLERIKARKRSDPPVTRDLELEAIGEIIEGKRWIHCHSYRQDEILAFLRLMESFEVQVGTLQHVLEGYKIADEIAKHGAGGSCFSDWWAYKFEVIDAIPYAGSLMHERGVVTSFNSDSSDLARRMNLEAAKAVKYGGLREEDALRFVTLNPAKQLRIERQVGSLEPGKDGDFVLWSESPLSSTTRCLQTWIEGKKYFDITLDGERTEGREKERAELLAKAKSASPTGKDKGAEDEKAVEKFFRAALEHEHDHVERHCLEHTEGGFKH